MRYAEIERCEICNGNDVGISLFVQGCPIHCKGCFNQSTWDFSGGKPWTPEVEQQFLDLADKPYIKRISILGGEPLARDGNIEESNYITVIKLIEKIRARFGKAKEIWVYTGYNIRDGEQGLLLLWMIDADYVVDGQYDETKRDITLKFRGSTNQRIIDLHESLKQQKVVTV